MGRRVALVGVAVLLTAAGLTSCSSSEEKASDAQVTYCDAVQNLQDTLAVGQSFTTSTSLDEVKQWRDDVSEAVDDVVSAGQDLSAATSGNLSSAYDDVKSVVEQQLADADTLGQAVDALSSAADSLRAETDAALQTYDCSSS